MSWLDKYEEGGYLGTTNKGFDYNGAWGGQFQSGGKTFLQPTSEKLPEGYRIPFSDPSSERAMSIGGENGEPAYLIPSFKYGRPIYNPIEEFKKTGEHLGGPFKTWQEADEWERTVRHPAVEKRENIMFPIQEFQSGGSLPGSVGFTYARTQGIPSEGPYAKKTMPSAQNGMEMKYYQEGLDWRPKTISRNGGWLDGYDEAQTGKQVLANDKRALEILEDIQKRKNKTNTPIKIKDERKQSLKKSESTNVKRKDFDLEQSKANKTYINALAEQKKEAARRANLTKEQREREDYNAYNEERGSIQQYVPESNWDRTKAIVSNPLTAFGYAARNQSLPARFQLGERNAHDYALDWINPLQGVAALSEIPGELSRGEFLEAGLSGLDALDLGVYAKGAMKASKPLLQKGVQQLKNIPTSIAPELRQGLKTAGPSFASSANNVTNISKNLEDLNYAKKWAKQYGYELPENLERIAQSDELTNRTVRGMMNRHNTFVRGVSTNWDELAKRNPDILKNLEERGINWKDNPEEAAKLMLTEIPPDTGYGRYMMNKGENALYTSNSIPTAQGYTYGDGYYAKLRRKNLDYSSNNRQDWINNNQLDYQKGINTPEGANIIKTDWQKRFPTSIEEFVKSAGNPNLLDDLMNKVDLKVKNKKSIIDKEWDKHLDVRKNIYNKAEEEMKKIYPDKTFHDYDYFDIRNSFITNADKKALDFTSKKIDKFRAFDPIKYEENQAIKEIFTTPEFYKSAFRNLIKPDKFGHYAFKGNPGEQIFDIVDLKKMTPELWQNKSRAHIGKYSKKLSALEEGGIIKDDRGQWAHPGEITEINSPYITMQGVPYPVLGVSNTGDVQMMYPEQEYEFDGDSVIEYPMARNGINNLDARPLVKLDQLTNFTNYNKPQPGSGWLSKYEN